MIHSITSQADQKAPASLLLIILVLGAFQYFYFSVIPVKAPGLAYATATGSTGLTIPYEITEAELSVDWAGGGDFDPRDKCPPDFFKEGFVVLCKKLGNGAFFRFLHHKGKKLLYRIDKDVIGGKTTIGLHWVEGTKYSARYRIADDAFKGGKKVQVPNAKGGAAPATFHYGQAVSKRRAQPGRELFKETPIEPDQCPEWWDILNFMP